ncbi:hypothetical protein ACFE04_012070 [Oxalis oulophora]
MDLLRFAPCNSRFSLLRKPESHRLLLHSSSSSTLHSKYRVKATSSKLEAPPVEFNGRDNGGSYSTATKHKVIVHDRERGVDYEFLVPEDQYILHTAEDQDINLPFACRHGSDLLFALLSELRYMFIKPGGDDKVDKTKPEFGCCTSCAVRVKSGEIRQPEALGISAELKSQGYALLCVGFPCSDLEVETQDEDEVYWLQFGRYFARGPIERDDYALELAMADE